MEQVIPVGEKAIPVTAVPGAWEAVADLGLQAEQAWIALASGDDPLMQTALKHKLATVRRELTGPAGSPLERLLIERVALCWLAVQLAEQDLALFSLNGRTIAHEQYYQDRLDRAQRRFLAAVKSLAQVRRLLAPAIQVNVGAQQFNLASR